MSRFFTFEWFSDEWIGYIGGFILSLCLLPQIIKALQTKSTEDISFIWQFMYITGLSGTVTYTYLEGVYPVAIPVTVELTLVVILTVIKFKYDVCNKRWTKPKKKIADVDPLINNQNE